MSKAIYNFHSDTCEYLSEGIADPSPLEDGVWLIPACATTVKPPPTAEHEVSIFDGVSWSIRPDWRNVALYSVADGAPVVIDEIGKIPADVAATELPRPSDVHAWRGGRWQESMELEQAILERRRAQANDAINAWKEAQTSAGMIFSHDGRRWDGGLGVRGQLEPTIAAAEHAGLPQGFFWTDADNQDIVVELEDLKALNAAHERALVARGWGIHVQQREMKRKIAVMTLAELTEFSPA